MRLQAVMALVPGIAADDLARWIEFGWITPDGAPPDGWHFRQIDLARVRLVRDLRADLGVAEEMVPVVLDLLDQIYDLRRTVKTMAHVLETQTIDVRASVLEALAHR